MTTPFPSGMPNRAERRRQQRARPTAASLTIKPLPEYGAGVRHILLDCEYAQTGMVVMDALNPDGPTISDHDAARIVLHRHWVEENCNCTHELRQRFGLMGGAA